MPTPLINTKDANLELMSGAEPLHILKDINFVVNPSEVVAIVGPSGSGKTSLLMVLAGLEQATGGQLVIAGQDPGETRRGPARCFPAQDHGHSFSEFPSGDFHDCPAKRGASACSKLPTNARFTKPWKAKC